MGTGGSVPFDHVGAVNKFKLLLETLESDSVRRLGETIRCLRMRDDYLPKDVSQILFLTDVVLVRPSAAGRFNRSIAGCESLYIVTILTQG